MTKNLTILDSIFKSWCNSITVFFLSITNKKHVNTQRNFIVDYYEEGQLVLGIDDDIQSIEMRISEKKTMPLLNLTEFVDQAFEISQQGLEFVKAKISNLNEYLT